MASGITVYTRTTCAYCVQVKRLLDMKKKTYNEVNVDTDRDAEAHVVDISGATTVPVVTMSDDDGNETLVSVGWNPAALLAAVA